MTDPHMHTSLHICHNRWLCKNMVYFFKKLYKKCVILDTVYTVNAILQALYDFTQSM